VLLIPGISIEVAKECSSIRSSFILFLSGLAIAHLLLQSTFRKTVLMISVIVIAIAKNGLRIFSLAFLGSRVDPGIVNGPLHQNGGILFFSLALLATLALALILHRGEHKLPLRSC
jgi:exosortase/archaeosortase family protein